MLRYGDHARSIQTVILIHRDLYRFSNLKIAFFIERSRLDETRHSNVPSAQTDRVFLCLSCCKGHSLTACPLEERKKKERDPNQSVTGGLSFLSLLSDLFFSRVLSPVRRGERAREKERGRSPPLPCIPPLRTVQTAWSAMLRVGEGESSWDPRRATAGLSSAQCTWFWKRPGQSSSPHSAHSLVSLTAERLCEVKRCCRSRD